MKDNDRVHDLLDMGRVVNVITAARTDATGATIPGKIEVTVHASGFTQSLVWGETGRPVAMDFETNEDVVAGKERVDRIQEGIRCVVDGIKSSPNHDWPSDTHVAGTIRRNMLARRVEKISRYVASNRATITNGELTEAARHVYRAWCRLTKLTE